MQPASDGGLFCAELTGSRRRIIFADMKSIAIQDIQGCFDELARDTERGEVVTVTRDGKPVFDIVTHNAEAAAKRKGGIDWEAGEAYLRSKGIVRTEGFIADDFDDPLPEDFLLRPLP
jgi:antitoxin (DNA-binding transcriptional repressor) of toxin-antitoxin stability system